MRPYPDGLAWDEALRQRRRAERLEELVQEIDRTLRVDAAEYVPAIRDVFTLIDRAGLKR